MVSALHQTSKQTSASHRLEVLKNDSDPETLSSDDTSDETRPIDRHNRGFLNNLKQSYGTKYVSRLRAFCFRWFLAGSCSAILALVAVLGWVALVIALIHRLSPTVSSTGLKYVVESWRSPKDSLQLLAAKKDELSNDLTPRPIHSHNDHWRKVPLFEALAAGCTGVEADIWLPKDTSSDELLVGHTKSALTDDRTLSNLYIEPLLYMLDIQNNQMDSNHLDGVSDTFPKTAVVLLFDFKEDSDSLWPLVNTALEYLRSPRNYLRSWNVTTNSITPGPLTIVISGEAELRSVVANITYRDISNSYYASSSLGSAIGHSWFGRFSKSKSATIQDQIVTAAEKNLLSRYWGTPSWPVSVRERVWNTLVEMKVGMLNADDVHATATWSWDWCVVVLMGSTATQLSLLIGVHAYWPVASL